MDQAAQLTLYVAEGDRVPPSQPHAQGQLLYQALIEAAQQTGMVGVTVMRSAVSYSQRYPHICVDWVMEFAPHQIVVLTLIDQAAAIARYLPRVKALVHSGLATQEAVTVVHHAPLSSDLTSSVPVPQQESPIIPYERLTIYLGEAEHWQGKPTYLALVEAARQHGLMGATVLRGLTGYGKKNHDRIVLLGMIELSADLPMVITIIDNRAKIEGFLPIVQSMVGGGIVLRDTVEVVHLAPLSQSS